MGLYLCVYDDNDELEGVEIGSYADFKFFRNSVTELLEGQHAGSKYPTLILHPDSDGEWTPTDCIALKTELEAVSNEFRRLPPIALQSEWQKQVGKSLGLKPSSLYDSFIDVDGEPLLERLLGLCEVALRSDLVPISRNRRNGTRGTRLGVTSECGMQSGQEDKSRAVDAVGPRTGRIDPQPTVARGSHGLGSIQAGFRLQGGWHAFVFESMSAARQGHAFEDESMPPGRLDAHPV